MRFIAATTMPPTRRMFHQIEGLWVDRGVKMSDLKGVLAFFAREIFGAETKFVCVPVTFRLSSRAPKST